MSVAPILAALGDESRLEIVRKLCKHGPLSIARIAEGAEISRQGITKHLHALHEAGLVRSERRSRERISRQWDEALSRLKATVEKERSR
jgi:DNA-binding transcriptional ArsR family regulator